MVSQITSPPKIVDVFAGVGGFSLGASRAGFELAAAIENDRYAAPTHLSNFPNAKHYGDVSEIDGRSLLVDLNLNHLDGLIGGPPCQGFSTIGRNRKNDLRNSLFGQFFRLVGEIKPSFFVAENVPGIMRPEFDHVRSAALDSVSNEFELLPPIRIAANQCGAATTRKRVFFIGFQPSKCDLLSEAEFVPQSKSQITVRKALDGLPANIAPNWQTEEQSWQKVSYRRNQLEASLRKSIPHGVGNMQCLRRIVKREVSGFLGTRHTPEVVRRFDRLKPGQTDGPSRATRLEWDGYCPTLRAGTGPDRGSYQAVRPIHPDLPRVIAPREAARLQGFPDWFWFHPTKWHSFRQIGNSVSPKVAEFLLSIIAKRIGI